jgi:hypothetical protein
MITNFFRPSLLLLVFGSDIRDPGWIKIRTRDKHPGFAGRFHRHIFSISAPLVCIPEQFEEFKGLVAVCHSFCTHCVSS